MPVVQRKTSESLSIVLDNDGREVMMNENDYPT